MCLRCVKWEFKMCQMSVSALLYFYMMLTLSPKCPFPISVNEIRAFETHSNRVEYKFVLVLLKSFSYLMTSRMNMSEKNILYYWIFIFSLFWSGYFKFMLLCLEKADDQDSEWLWVIEIRIIHSKSIYLWRKIIL